MMCEQTGQEIDWEKCPPDWSDFPNIVLETMNLYHSLGNKVYPEIGFTGKDYTNFEFLYNYYDVPKHQKDFVLELLLELEGRDVSNSQQKLKAEYDRIKKK